MEVGEAGEKARWPRTRSRLSRVLVSRFALKIYINYASGAATTRHVYSSVQSAAGCPYIIMYMYSTPKRTATFLLLLHD